MVFQQDLERRWNDDRRRRARGHFGASLQVLLRQGRLLRRRWRHTLDVEADLQIASMTCKQIINESTPSAWSSCKCMSRCSNACAKFACTQPIAELACRVTGIWALLRRRLGGPSEVLVRRAALASSPPGMAVAVQDCSNLLQEVSGSIGSVPDARTSDARTLLSRVMRYAAIAHL